MPVTVLAVVLLGPAAALAARDDFIKFEQPEFEHDESLVEQWREQATEVPPLPPEDELEVVPFDATPPGLTFYAAPESFLIGEDRVTRFWLLSRSDRGGPYNGTYYGLRCETRELKTFAFVNARRDPPVRPHPKPSWQPARPHGFEREMSRIWFCADKAPLDAGQIERNIRHGVNLSPRTYIDSAN